MVTLIFFFFSSRRRHTRYWRDWSSDVCSSDLLTVVTGTGDVTRTFTGHLKSGFFKKMLEKSRIEMVLNSDKHPETAFGGATSFAALLELTKNDKGDFEGYAALDGSVYKIYCPKDPAKYFDSGRSK